MPTSSRGRSWPDGPAQLRWVDLTPGGELDLTALDGLLTERTKVFAFTHVSNVLGHGQPGP